MLCFSLDYKELGKHDQAPLPVEYISLEFIQFKLKLNWKTFLYYQKVFLKIITFFAYNFKFDFF